MFNKKVLHNVQNVYIINLSIKEERYTAMTKLHHYKGFIFEKPEGCKYWNIWKPGKIHPFGGKKRDRCLV